MSSYGTPQLLSGVKSAADYSTTALAGVYRFVKLNSTAAEVVRCVANEAPVGILQNMPDAGQAAEVAMPGGIGARLTLGGTVAKGDFIRPDANGDGVLASAGEVAGAIAMEAGVDNDIISVIPVRMQVPVIVLTAYLADISTASATWLTSPVAGRIAELKTVLHGAISGANANISMENNGTAVDGLAIVVAYSGSAAGDVDSDTPTSGHASTVVAAGTKLKVTTDGASTDTAAVTVVLTIVPTAG